MTEGCCPSPPPPAISPQVCSSVTTTDQPQTSTLPAETFGVALFGSLTDTQPRARTVSWNEVITSLTRHKLVRTKEEAELWSPAVYRPGAERCNEGVVEVTL